MSNATNCSNVVVNSNDRKGMVITMKNTTKGSNAVVNSKDRKDEVVTMKKATKRKRHLTNKEFFAKVRESIVQYYDSDKIRGIAKYATFSVDGIFEVSVHRDWYENDPLFGKVRVGSDIEVLDKRDGSKVEVKKFVYGNGNAAVYNIPTMIEGKMSLQPVSTYALIAYTLLPLENLDLYLNSKKYSISINHMSITTKQLMAEARKQEFVLSDDIYDLEVVTARLNKIHGLFLRKYNLYDLIVPAKSVYTLQNFYDRYFEISNGFLLSAYNTDADVEILRRVLAECLMSQWASKEFYTPEIFLFDNVEELLENEWMPIADTIIKKAITNRKAKHEDEYGFDWCAFLRIYLEK